MALGWRTSPLISNDQKAQMAPAFFTHAPQPLQSLAQAW
jgi:hypothetical protein